MKIQADGSQSQKAGAVEATGEDASETYTDIDGIEGSQKLRMISCTGSV